MAWHRQPDVNQIDSQGGAEYVYGRYVIRIYARQNVPQNCLLYVQLLIHITAIDSLDAVSLSTESDRGVSGCTARVTES